MNNQNSELKDDKRLRRAEENCRVGWKEFVSTSDPFDITHKSHMIHCSYSKELISAALIETEVENETNKWCNRLLSSGSNHVF